jgi:hypothetical protein
MSEVGIAYVLTGPDGTRAVVGNCDAAVADPDFVGYLDPANGITGLLDGAEVRETTSDIVGGDGGIHGPFWLGRRPGTVNGVLLPNSDMPAVNLAERKLKRATRALRADGTLTWTPSGESLQRMLRYRRQQKPGITGRRPKAFQIALVSADPYVLSSSEASLVITPGAAAGELGIANPITNPITSPLNVTAQQFVVNQGDAVTWPRVRIDGPITNPELLNQTSGLRVRIVYTLAAGEWLDVFFERGAILLGGTADRYSALDFSQSTWWQLLAGINDVRLLAAAYSAGAQATIYWRHAWE